MQKLSLDVDPWTGRISRFRVEQTIQFTDPHRLLARPVADVLRRRALNGLNPLLLNDDASELGRSLDPEGFVIDPRTGHFIVADEYGPSVFEFDRKGRLLFVFETPENLVPRVNTVSGGVETSVVNYVALRDACTATLLPPSCGLNDGRQDNRGFEGIAITPDGKKLYAVMQDPLVDEPTHNSNNGRNGRNVRVVVFDNDKDSPSFGTSLAQYAYQLEKQADVLARAYVDFAGHYARCPLGETTGCEIDGDGVDTGDFTEDVPAGHVLLPGVLHAYRASASDLAGYVPPKSRRRHDHDCDDDRPHHPHHR